MTMDMDYGITFRTKICPDGVECHDYGEHDDGQPNGRTLLDDLSQATGVHFRERSRRQDDLRIDVVGLEDPTIVRFLNARSDGDLADFLSRFGMLIPTREFEPRADDVAERVKHRPRELARSYVIQHQKGLGRLLSTAVSSKPAAAVAAVNKAIASHKSFAAYPELSLIGNARHPKVTLHPQHLIGLMTLEVAMAAVSGANMGKCEHCGKVFLTGPNTGRRSTARFCSDRCRVAANRAKNA